MPSITLEEVQPGWKVYARAEEVGRVVEVGDHDIAVRRGGLLLRHVVRIPKDYVVEAGGGIVDLGIEPEAMNELERGSRD